MSRPPLQSVDAARAAMLADLPAPRVETVPLAEAHGRVLARPIVASRDQPPFDASAMDGYAVRSADAPGELAVVGESAAGRGHLGVLGPGEAVRIFTGAPVPAGADAIVIQEEAERSGDRVRAPAVPPGKHLRRRGGDFAAGEALLPVGARLDAWRLSLAASATAAEVQVTARPRVAVLSTGEEIVPLRPGMTLGPDQIADSSGVALAARIAAWGGTHAPLTPVGDDLQAIAAAVAAVDADLLVTVGGASVGDHDLVKPALATLGLELVVDKVNMRPGKPVWFGRYGGGEAAGGGRAEGEGGGTAGGGGGTVGGEAGGRRVLGLPGNPASALVCAELFLKPLLLALQGAAPGPALARVRFAGPQPANPGREHWMRARIVQAADGGEAAEPFPEQDSSLVSVFAGADLLVRRPAAAGPADALTWADAIRLERL